MGSVSGNGSYTPNITVSIAAVANTGYYFVQWNDGNTNNPRTITVTQDTSFEATFAVFVPVMHQVTVTASNPTMGSVSGNGNYTPNTTVAIAAVANTGYYFVQWNDGNTSNPRTITVTQDTSFEATFAVFVPTMHLVTVSANNPTMGNVSGNGSYTPNTTVSIAAVANAGYYFVQWNDGNTSNPRSFTITQDTTFTAIFESGVGTKSLEISTISVYPNPATDNIYITLPENVARAVFTLYDMQSKMLIRQEISNQDIVSVSHLATGTYIYHVRTEKESYQGKVVKH
jgi:hypothetical protein